MIRVCKFFFALAILVLISVACNEDPTSVGSNLLTEKDKVNFKQLDSYDANLFQKSGYYEDKLKLGISDRILLGKNSYAESSALYRYSVALVDTMQTRLLNGDLVVEKAWMQLTPQYTLGDNTANFDFTVHQIRSDWSMSGFDRDSIPNLKYDAANVSYDISQSDTVIQFNINNNVITEWLKRNSDTLTTPKNYGLILKPKSTTQKFIGFNSAVAYPSANETLLFVVLNRPSYYKDTVAFAPFSNLHTLTSTLPSQSSNFYLQGGYALRGNIFFDVSSLPKNIIINKATLELPIDTLKTFDGSNSSDSIYVQRLADSTTHKLASDSTTVLILTRQGKIFSGDITLMVQKWESGLENQGLLLALWDEYASAARIAFYGSKNPDKTLRPKLKIIYMQKQ